ncbi:ABC transporter ATP-binding protein [Ensifer sp. BR816]|uniref:ABC transporter ATP-binding protein n=1 Tax=Rhizobium sp. (strain BR816) TaxID=1057002 RepID=UPI000364D434|nr:ABC transporter ATP-binding protein [Ensifer sp. BR816]
MGSTALLKSSVREGDAIVSFDRVEKRFGEFVAIEDLSLDVRRGEFLTLLGPSGCGKTTTLRLINGFELPTRGTVAIDGQAVSDLPPFKRCVNTVFQSYALFPHLTVEENVAYGLVIKRLPRRDVESRVRDMLERVRLSDKAKRRPRDLSGGQMQRVALARALVNEPAVLLLDEPLGALDAKLRRSMQFELRRMHQDLKLTIVCVTHDQEEALTMSDRIAIMNSGELIQLGTPREVFERPTCRFVADFIGGCNFLAGSVDGAGVVKLTDGIAIKDGDSGPPRKVTIAVRPQNISLVSPEATPFTAIVRDVAYLGTMQRVALERGEVSLHADCPENYADIRPGGLVGLKFDPEHIALFEEG